MSAESNPQEFSVLFGTIHLSIDEHHLRQKIRRWIDEFDYVYTETPLNPDGQSLILPYITVPHTKWGEYFNPTQQRRIAHILICLLYTSPSPRDGLLSRMPSSA